MYAVRSTAEPAVEKTTDNGTTFVAYVAGLDPSLVVADAVYWEGVNSVFEQCDDLILATDHGLWTRTIHCALDADVDSISLSAGGVQNLTLTLGPKHAFETYFVLGSASGTSPGVPLDGKVLPLNLDAYFTLTAVGPNAPPLVNTFGTFDATGITTAQIVVPAGFSPSLAGVTLHHAYLSIVLAPVAFVDLISNACALTFVP